MTNGLDGIQGYLVSLALTLPIILFSLTLHECAHGWMAMKLGDRTAYNLGRLTLNPIKHLDPIGFLCMLVFGYGWAKPVPIQTRNFKNPRKGMAISAIAGPISNLLLGFCFVILYNLSNFGFGIALQNGGLSSERSLIIAGLVLTFFELGAMLNVYLAVFNLLPVPPFDGSRLLLAFLPTRIYFKIQQYERYIFIALIVLLFTGLLNVPLNFCIEKITDLYMWMFNIPWALPIGLLASLLY